MEETIYIYSLIDPTTNIVRYVGKTSDVERRYKEHLRGDNSNSHKNNWIKKLLKQYKKPTLIILEECNNTSWEERERYWISQYDNLTNSTEGGEDGKMSVEVRKKMSKLNSGHNNPMYKHTWTDEQRMNLSNSLKGRTLSEEHKIELSKSLGRKCIIDGVEYRSMVHAQTELGVGWRVVKRLMDK